MSEQNGDTTSSQLIDIVNQNLQTLRQENKEAHQAIQNALDKQNGRLRKLEQWRSWMLGGMALLAFGLVLVVRFLSG